MMWHDCSTTGGHSNLLMMLACMYDPAWYFTDIEFHRKYNELVNIQAIVETPVIYILARYPSNYQQLLYSEERLDDILKLNENMKTLNNIEIIDKLRVFKEDKPAFQFEAGQQNGGNFYCFLCAAHAENASSYVHTHRKYIETINDRIKPVKKTDLSVSKTSSLKMKLYDNLNKDELIAKLRGRDVKFSCTESKNDLQSKLEDVIHGIQRVPALIYFNSINDISQLNLQFYEILFTEPLHDILNHIKNLYAELPHHTDKKFKKSFNFLINNSFNGKEAKNASDYCKSLLIVTQWFLGNHEDHIFRDILTTLCEIQEIIYLPANQIQSQTVLQLYIITFIHMLCLKMNLRGNLKKLTRRKFFQLSLFNLPLSSII